MGYDHQPEINGAQIYAQRILVVDDNGQIYLNGFEGWDLLHYIRKIAPNLPVLIVTAYDNYRDDPRASEANGYIVKNLMALETLKQRIDDILGEEPIYA